MKSRNAAEMKGQTKMSLAQLNKDRRARWEQEIVPTSVPSMRHKICQLGGIAAFVESFDIDKLPVGMVRALAHDANVHRRTKLKKADLVAAIKKSLIPLSPHEEEVDYWFREPNGILRQEAIERGFQQYKIAKDELAENIAVAFEQDLQDLAETQSPHARSAIAELNFKLTGHRVYSTPMELAEQTDKQTLRKTSVSYGFNFGPEWTRLQMLNKLFLNASIALPSDMSA